MVDAKWFKLFIYLSTCTFDRVYELEFFNGDNDPDSIEDFNEEDDRIDYVTIYLILL